METIIPNQTFKHGGDAYEEGQSYEVSEDDALHFREAGWIGERTPGSDATLDVQDMQLGHSAEVN